MTSVLDKPAVVDGAAVGKVNTIQAKALHTALSDVLLFAAAPSVRLPFLEAVRLEFGAGRLVAAATDRFVLGVSRVDYTGDAFTMTLAGADAKALVKLAKTVKRDERSRMVVIEAPEAASAVPVVTFRFSTGESMTVRGLDAEFPKWRHLVPADDARMGGIVGMGYNPSLVSKFTKVRPDEAGAGARMLVFPTRTTSGAPGPTAIQIGEDFMGLLMPIRAPGDTWRYDRPGWFDPSASVAASGTGEVG